MIPGGVKQVPPKPLSHMPESTDLPTSNGALDELVSQLLGCGAVLSQIVSHMIRFRASGRSLPETAPIPTIAHDLLVSVLTDVRHTHSRRDLMVAARIVGEVTDAVCESIFCVDPDALEELGVDDQPDRTSE